MLEVRQAPERWAKGKRDFLENFLELPGGLPSRDCIRRVLIALEPEAFQKCFRRWLASHMEQTEDGQPRPNRHPMARPVAAHMIARRDWGRCTL
ncbi:MAG: transposase family protein [Pirellulaceae bacterium]|nr:transposase family protein [Pirellulaceae bacterium]